MLRRLASGMGWVVTADAPWTVRPIDPGSAAEIEIVADRMRATLIEVLGEARGGSMYSDAWLRDRVRFHLDPARSVGAVFVAVVDEAIVGHTIVRLEREDDDRPLGLFSTTYVEPSSRRTGVASALLDCGEAWMRDRGLTRVATYTDERNVRLIRLYEKHGYRIVEARDEMVKLERAIGA